VRWNLETPCPPRVARFRVRCRIIISIIPDPNYDGINSRPPARKREYQKRGRTGEEESRARGNDRDEEEDREAGEMVTRVGE